MLDLLADTHQSDDEVLPDTGFGLERERFPRADLHPRRRLRHACEHARRSGQTGRVARPNAASGGTESGCRSVVGCGEPQANRNIEVPPHATSVRRNGVRAFPATSTAVSGSLETVFTRAPRCRGSPAAHHNLRAFRIRGRAQLCNVQFYHSEQCAHHARRALAIGAGQQFVEHARYDLPVEAEPVL